MKATWIGLIVLLAFAASDSADARQPRSAGARHRFAKATACPSTGSHRLPCPGYDIDHVVPLCSGGEDAPANMQWQTVEDAREKDREERRACRALRARPARGDGSGGE